MAIKDFFLRLIAGRRPKAPVRDTEQFPRLTSLGSMGINGRKAMYKPSPPNIRYFSRTPYARRAINHIKDPICCLEWEIAPLDGIKSNRHLEQQIQVATECFKHPNTDDSWRSFIGQAVEDWLVFGAGVIEQQLGGNEARPIWMWPVDAQSIQIFPCWSGGKDEARYMQTIGYTNVGLLQGRKLRNDEIIYMRANESTESPYGFGALEIAFNSVNRLLGVAEFTGNLASNAQPQMMLHFADADDDRLRAFRTYWRNEVEGQGVTPMFGGRNEPKAITLHPGGDDALYLDYQTFVIREIATAFGLSPQNLGVESDVNRSTAEVATDRDWDNTIIPLAELICSYLTREALHSKLGYYQLEFKFISLYREDEESTAKIYETYYKTNAITPNEQRAKMGLEPLDNEWADKPFADTQIALSAARGAAVIDDKDIDDGKKQSPKAKGNTKTKAGNSRKDSKFERKAEENA